MTWLQHFALARDPFAAPEHADDLFETRALREARSRLSHLFDLRGIGLLTGESGCGKTSVARQAVGRLHPSRHRIVYISLTTGSVIDTFQCLAWGLGLPTVRTRAVAYRAIRSEITRLACESGQLPVILIDEAHLLRGEVLEHLRLLTNFAMDSQQRLCLLLVGLSEIKALLARARYESLCQRILVRHQLDGLDRDELEPYLEDRLRRAGCELPLFEASAVQALFQASRGLPRQVNRIARFALCAAACDNARQASADHVSQARAEVIL